MARRRLSDSSKAHKKVSKGKHRCSSIIKITSIVESKMWVGTQDNYLVILLDFPRFIQSALEGNPKWFENLIEKADREKTVVRKRIRS